MEWNMVAEFLSLVFSVILYVSYRRDNELKTTRTNSLNWLYASVIGVIAITLISSYASAYYEYLPITVTQISMFLYYGSLPLPALMCCIYISTLMLKKSSGRKRLPKWAVISIPHYVYLLIIIANLFCGVVYEVNAEEGYIRGYLYLLPYVACSYYFVRIFITTLANNKMLMAEVYRGLMLSCVLASIAMVAQFFLADIILTGSAWFVALLIIHMFLHNVKKTRDSLTTLYNRATLLYRMQLRTSKKKPFYLYVFSLRNFKATNERMGLEHGDALLEEIGISFKALFPDECVYRYSGDEFALLLDDMAEKNAKLVNVLAAMFGNSFYVDGAETELDIVYARVDYPAFGGDVRQLITAVDYSISTAKRTYSKINYVYEQSICDQMARRNEVIGRIKHALAHDEFEVYYQAIYSVEEGKFTEAEALVRLNPNSKNMVSPGEFIPLAEQSGLIVQLTYIVLEKVCRDIARLKESGVFSSFNAVSINFPYMLFLQQSMFLRVTGMLEKYGVAPGEIRIEITERTLVSDADRVQEVMLRMQSAGFIFELDDFGVEYSNMSLFLKLPVDIMKVDKSLVDTVMDSEQNMEFFRCLIQGTKAVNSKIIVEGVENKRTLDFVVDCRCDYVQGYVLVRPLPYDEFLEFLLKSNK